MKPSPRGPRLARRPCQLAGRPGDHPPGRPAPAGHRARAAVGLLVALPLGVWLGHLRRGGAAVTVIANVSRADPHPRPAHRAGARPQLRRQHQDRGRRAGAVRDPADPDQHVRRDDRRSTRGTVEAARGLGMGTRQVLLGVELPLALPLIAAGHPQRGAADLRHRDARVVRRQPDAGHPDPGRAGHAAAGSGARRRDGARGAGRSCWTSLLGRIQRAVTRAAAGARSSWRWPRRRSERAASDGVRHVTRSIRRARTSRVRNGTPSGASPTTLSDPPLRSSEVRAVPAGHARAMEAPRDTEGGSEMRTDLSDRAATLRLAAVVVAVPLASAACSDSGNKDNAGSGASSSSGGSSSRRRGGNCTAKTGTEHRRAERRQEVAGQRQHRPGRSTPRSPRRR